MAAKFPNAKLNFKSFSSSSLARTIKKFPISSTLVHKELATGRANKSRLSLVWKEVQGMNNWEKLIHPLDSLLRDEIIRYGEFVWACYKAFDLQSDSKRYLNCKFGKSNLLSEVGLNDSGYEVTKFIYATPDINVPIQTLSSCLRWMGYVAISNDIETKNLGRRDVVVTFRGTVTNPEWIANFMSTLTPPRFDPYNPRPEVMVETGFLNLYTSKDSESKFGPPSCREQLLSEVSRLINKYKSEEEEMSITLAGHSMGSSLATLLAYDIAELGINCINDYNTKLPITVFSFGGPKVGNSGFKQRCEELGVRVLRIVNINDPVTKLPGIFFNEGFKILADKYGFPFNYFSCYTHVGVELVLNFFNINNPSCVHQLEDYIISLLNSSPMEDNHTKHDHDHDQREFNSFDFICKTKKFVYGVQMLYWLWTNEALNMVQFLSLII